MLGDTDPAPILRWQLESYKEEKMSLSPCRECGHKVSKQAKTCPSCGVDNPVVGVLSSISNLIKLFLVGILAWAFISTLTTDDEKEPVKESVIDEETCKQDLNCWYDKHGAKMKVACGNAVERLAKWDYEWTAWLTRWRGTRWHNKESGVMRTWGDEIKFQNGFGAWQRMNYFCNYDPTTGRADAIVEPRNF